MLRNSGWLQLKVPFFSFFLNWSVYLTLKSDISENFRLGLLCIALL